MGEAVKEIIQAIKSMPRSLLFYLISIGLTVMYWFISLYLFHRGFYDSNPIGIVLLFSFALTIPYLLISTIIAAEVTVVLEDNIAKDADGEFVAIITGGVALQYLFIVMGGCYIHRNKCGIEYSTFLYWTFGVVIAIAILFAFGAIAVTKERNKKKKNEEERLQKELELGLDFINDLDKPKHESED